jgi:hypothetical protein
VIGINFPSKSGDLWNIDIKTDFTSEILPENKETKGCFFYSYGIHFEKGEGFVRINRNKFT